MTTARGTRGAVRSRRPRRSTVLIVTVLLVTLVLVALGTRSATREASLDPDNPGPDGAQALARVLADEGVEVEVARDAEALEARAVDADTTVLVTSPADLGSPTADRLMSHATDGEVVVAGPGIAVLGLLDVDALPAPTGTDGPVAAECDDDPAEGVQRGRLDLSGLSAEVEVGDAYPLPGCFAVDGGSLLVRARPGLTLLGADLLMSNDQVLRADNAAVALRLLGSGDRLVWYVPDPADLSADDRTSLGALLPPWLVPSLWLLFLTSLVAIWWRARRFGPLATEPLPVSVKATETTRSRGRLYHRSRDRGHAAAALRRATRDRVAARLGIPTTPPPPGAPDPVVTDVARRTGRPADVVGWLLSPAAGAPSSDDDLIALADAQAELDREVHRS